MNGDNTRHDFAPMWYYVLFVVYDRPLVQAYTQTAGWRLERRNRGLGNVSSNISLFNVNHSDFEPNKLELIDYPLPSVTAKEQPIM